jgi:hypothetical protein
MNAYRVFAAALLLALSGASSVLAGSSEGIKPAYFAQVPSLANMTAAEFLAFHDQLAKSLSQRSFAHVDTRARESIAAAQQELRAALRDVADINVIGDDKRRQVFDAHERVVAVLNQAEGNRVVCTKEHQIGSHFPKTLCMTVRERELMERETQRRMLRKGQSLD